MFNHTPDIYTEHVGSGFVCFEKRKSLDCGFGSGALKGISDVVTGMI